MMKGRARAYCQGRACRYILWMARQNDRMTAEQRPSLFRRLRYDYIAAGFLTYVAVTLWFGPDGFGLLALANIIGILYTQALRR